MRTKEDAADYRYFPDPDLPPLVVPAEWVERVRSQMAELPRVMAARFVQDYGLPEYDATTLTQSKAMAAYFVATVNAGAPAKLAANWIMGDLLRRLNQGDIDILQSPVSAENLAWMIERINDGTISNSAAKKVLDSLWAGEITGVANLAIPAFQLSATGGAGNIVDGLIEKLGLKQMNDSGALDKIVDEVIAANPDNVAQFKAGKDKAFNALVGQAMKASKGKANPAQVNELLRKKLGG
jgi:aspartyl-tRNA(Asn)/glutamyl-tRNA(Gln) amidotransferase subunit B